MDFKIWFWAISKLPLFVDRSQLNINNIRSVEIGKFRCFEAAENPNLEVHWVYVLTNLTNPVNFPQYNSALKKEESFFCLYDIIYTEATSSVLLYMRLESLIFSILLIPAFAGGITRAEPVSLKRHHDFLENGFEEFPDFFLERELIASKNRVRHIPSFFHRRQIASQLQKIVLQAAPLLGAVQQTGTRIRELKHYIRLKRGGRLHEESFSLERVFTKRWQLPPVMAIRSYNLFAKLFGQKTIFFPTIEQLTFEKKDLLVSDMQFKNLKIEDEGSSAELMSGLFFATPAWKSNFRPFLDLRGHMLRSKHFAANAGLGFRQALPKYHLAIGSNVYYDGRKNDKCIFSQMGAGLELLGAFFHLRLNGYLPLGQFTTKEGVTLAGSPLPFSPYADGLLGLELPKIPVSLGIGSYFLKDRVFGGKASMNIKFKGGFTLSFNGSRFRNPLTQEARQNLESKLSYKLAFGERSVKKPAQFLSRYIAGEKKPEKGEFTKRLETPGCRNEIIHLSAKPVILN